MVVDFVSQTGCDLLAVAVGNVHGLDIEPKVDLPLLEQISKSLQFHLSCMVDQEFLWYHSEGKRI